MWLSPENLICLAYHGVALPLVLVPGEQAVDPLPQASGIISASLVPRPQACSRLSIFSATHPQPTETAHASLHARDPAQPHDAGIFRRPDARKCSSLLPSLAPFEKGRETELLAALRAELCASGFEGRLVRPRHLAGFPVPRCFPGEAQAHLPPGDK